MVADKAPNQQVKKEKKREKRLNFFFCSVAASKCHFSHLVHCQVTTVHFTLLPSLSIGNISGYVLGWQGSALLNAMPFMKTSTRILFTISCIFLLITCIVTCIVAKERKHHLTAAQVKKTKNKKKCIH